MRNFSARAYNSLIQRVTDEIWFALLELHVDASVFRVVANSKDPVVSNGETYQPYPFDVLLPADSMESAMSVQISIDNVDRMLVDSLRAAVNPLEFVLRFVLASQPNVVELELTDLQSQQVTFDAGKIVATVAVNDIWNAKYPSVGGIYDPAQCPGLF